MSDEPPPSLRLKPRLKPEADPAVSGADAASEPTPKAEEGGMKIRLRPKMMVEPEVEEIPEGVPEGAALDSPDDISTESEPIIEEELPPMPLPTPVAAEGPKFRLKTRAADPAPSQLPQPPAPTGFHTEAPPESDPAHPPAMMQFDPSSEAMNIPMPSSPLYIPTVETPATESVRLDLSHAVPPPPSLPFPEEEQPAEETPLRRKAFQPKAGTIGLIAAAIFILGCGAFFVRRVITAPSAARPVKTKSRIKSIPVVPEPTPTPTPTPAPPLPVIDDVRPKSATNLVTTPIAPGISATSAGAVEAVNASPAFRSWVASARISGVFQGAVPRALINGRTIRAGSIADDALAITFESIDAENKTIVFKDRSGAEVSRRY